MYEKPCKLYWVYIMASRPRGVLYVGMTSDRPGRAWQHRERVREGFTKRYWVGRLVYFERYEDAAVAARRERALKRWRRDWKIELIEKHNPTWRDLFSEVLAEEGFEV
jgi:putative endonuclease